LIQFKFGKRTRAYRGGIPRPGADMHRRLALAVLAAALLAAPLPAAAGDEPIKAVYHLSDADKARTLLNNVRNHLNADPAARIVVVTNSSGIDFLLRDAADRNGPFAPQIEELALRGVVFGVCRNTLTGRKLDDSAVVREAKVIQSGVAEVAKLQAREGYVYVKP
jgi:intracellular sulfur oxidation DsrE/DsrF family protein